MHDQHDPAPRRVSAAGIVAPARRAATPPPPSASPPRRSAAGLTVPAKRPPAATSAPALPRRRAPFKDAAFLDGLRGLRDSLPPNKDVRAVALIMACIEGGVRTKSNIVFTLGHLGFDPRHVGAVIDREARSSAATLPRWRKGADGRYTLLD